jgi:hypothetical protein
MGFIRESSEKPLITSFFLISFQIPVSVRLSYRLAVKEYARGDMASLDRQNTFYVYCS